MKKFFLIIFIFTVFFTNEKEIFSKGINKEDKLILVILNTEKKQEISEYKKIIGEELGINMNENFTNTSIFITNNSEIEITKLKNKKYKKYIKQIFEVEREIPMNSIEINDLKWPMETIKLNEEYKNIYGLSGKNINIAVIDSGIKKEHFDLTNTEHYICPRNDQTLLCDKTESPIPMDNHGTHVAGIIAANYNRYDEIQEKGNTGVAFNANLIDFNVAYINELGETKIDVWAVANAYNTILKLNSDEDIENNINIINNSFGIIGDQDYTDAFSEINKKVFDKGINVVVSAGNDGTWDETENNITSEAKSDFSIAVGSIDENNSRASDSATGEELDIVAPGVNIYSTLNYKNIDMDDKHGFLSGTSMAAPHISGILALYRENYPTFGPSLIENMLYEQATDLEEDGKDNSFGHGLASAIPPKYYVINKDLELDYFTYVYKFPNSIYPPFAYEDLSELKAIRAKDWNEDKKRFDWYYLSRSNDEIDGVGWIKSDDSFNNKEIDRETINFTDTNLILYNSPNFDSYEKTIEINPKRIRTHVSEEKIINPETGKTEWFKINLPEYSIENKWIYIPAYKQNLTSEYREIKFEMSVQENSLVFYDDPELLTNPTTSNVVQNKLAYVSEGYEWVDYKTGYRWYKVSIPALGIENKWINTGDYWWGNIHQYGLMDKLSGRSIEEKDITSFQLLKTNNNGDVKIKPQGNVTYRFDNAALVKQVFVKNYYNESVKNLKIEFYNKSNEIIYSKDIKNEDINSRHLHLNFETEIPNVYYYKLINTSETDLYLTSFDIFGDFDISAIPPKKINFEQSFFSNSYTFYDEPELKTNPQIVGALQDKRTIISEGYYWIEEKKGYRWYKVSIPELNIFNKWVNVGDQVWGNIERYGLMDDVSSRSIVEENFSEFLYLKINHTGNPTIGSQGYVEYRFDKPVSIKQILIKKKIKELDNSKLAIEFLDINKNRIGNLYNFDNKNDFYEQHINLEEVVEGVYYYKMWNMGNEVIKLDVFDLFGTYENSAIEAKDINFNRTFNNNSYTFYDEPELNSISQKFENLYTKTAEVTKGRFWVEEKKGYRWYRVSVPELDIYNKWINTGDEQWGNIEAYGLMDKVSGQSIEEIGFYGFNLLKLNHNVDSTINSDGHVLYKFDTPVSISKMFIKKYDKRDNKSNQLTLELFDVNQDPIGGPYMLDNKNIFYEQYINLPQTVDNVYYYKLSNTGADAININVFDLY